MPDNSYSFIKALDTSETSIQHTHVCVLYHTEKHTQ